MDDSLHSSNLVVCHHVLCRIARPEKEKGKFRAKVLRGCSQSHGMKAAVLFPLFISVLCACSWLSHKALHTVLSGWKERVMDGGEAQMYIDVSSDY